MRFCLLFSFAALFLGGCAVNGYQAYYIENGDPKTDPAIEMLDPGDEPKVYGSDDLKQDVLRLRAKHYEVLGYSAFNGEFQGTQNIVAQAKRVGASIVLVDSEYTNTEIRTSTLLVSNSQTTYYSGSAYGAEGTASIYGSSTTYGSQPVPIQRASRRYDQTAYFLAKTTYRPRIGFGPVELPQKLRRELERNTGVLLTIIFEDTPAFYANLLPGDVLIELNGDEIKNLEDAYKLASEVPENAESVNVTVIRNGKDKDITINL